MSLRSVIPPGRRAVRAAAPPSPGTAADKPESPVRAHAGAGDRAPARVQHAQVLSDAAADPVGLGNAIRVSCGQLGSDVVLMGESAEDLFPVDLVLGKVDRLGWTGVGLSRG